MERWYLDKCNNFLQIYLDKINDIISIILSAKNLVLSVSSSNLDWDKAGFKLNVILSIEVGWCLSKQIKCKTNGLYKIWLLGLHWGMEKFN